MIGGPSTAAGLSTTPVPVGTMVTHRPRSDPYVRHYRIRLLSDVVTVRPVTEAGVIAEIPTEPLGDAVMEAATSQPHTPAAIRADPCAIFISLELSRSTWLITSQP